MNKIRPSKSFKSIQKVVKGNDVRKSMSREDKNLIQKFIISSFYVSLKKGDIPLYYWYISV